MNIPEPQTESPFTVSSETILIPINYADDIQKMIDDGNYERATLLLFAKKEDIKPKYEVGIRDYEMKTLTLAKYSTTKEVLNFVQQVAPCKTWKEARIEHLLAFGAKMPKEQLENQIFALGTPIRLSDGINFPRLENLYHQRGLSLIGTDEKSVWSPHHQFLIYRES
jgi:hypothetical protein